MKFFTLEKNHMFGIERNIIEDYELMSMLRETIESGKLKEITINGCYWCASTGFSFRETSVEKWTCNYGASWIFSFVESDIKSTTSFFILGQGHKLYSHHKMLDFISSSLAVFPHNYGDVLEDDDMKNFSEAEEIIITLMNDDITKYQKIQGEVI